MIKLFLKLKDFYKKYYNYFPADLWAFIAMILIIGAAAIWIL
jgi:hypothetical protein